MKYICWGYFDKGKRGGLTEGEQHAMFDTCFAYDDQPAGPDRSFGCLGLTPYYMKLTR